MVEDPSYYAHKNPTHQTFPHHVPAMLPTHAGYQPFLDWLLAKTYSQAPDAVNSGGSFSFVD